MSLEATFDHLPESREIVTWRGKPIEDMTREELIRALKTAGRMYHAVLYSHKRTLATWDLCRRAR